MHSLQAVLAYSLVGRRAGGELIPNPTLMRKGEEWGVNQMVVQLLLATNKADRSVATKSSLDRRPVAVHVPSARSSVSALRILEKLSSERDTVIDLKHVIPNADLISRSSGMGTPPHRQASMPRSRASSSAHVSTVSELNLLPSP